MASANKKYDVILFGVTGFTGKLTAEYLIKSNYDMQWAVCARNKAKAEAVLGDICDNKPLPTILAADLVCDSPEKLETLRQVVQQTKVVLTCAGPFEKYGTTLVKLCAEEGVSYADITGETDFVRSMITQHDKTARENGAIIVCHCGNDCIPQDLTCWEMFQYASKNQATLKQVSTYVELPESATMSGGTAATAAYQLGKNRNSQTNKPEFDPLLQTPEGTKSEFMTKNISPKSNEYLKDLDCNVGPWIMAPVMVNCVRRSNALLHYSKDFEYGDSQVKNASWSAKLHQTATAMSLGAAIVLGMTRFLPQPGEGPDRQTMEEGYMTLHGRGVMIKNGKEMVLHSKFHFNKDIGYLYTAALLAETGMVLLEKHGKLSGGVMTPAVALGSDLTQRILKTMDTSFEIKEEELQVV